MCHSDFPDACAVTLCIGYGGKLVTHYDVSALGTSHPNKVSTVAYTSPTFSLLLCVMLS